MRFSIGIVHGEQTAEWVERMWGYAAGMRREGLDFQLILVGPEILNAPKRPYLEYITFDEKLNGKAWITKKKNLITEYARHENIVYMHDYIEFFDDWYEGWCQFGEDFQVANNRQVITDSEGKCFRHSDWTVDPYEIWALKPDWHWKFWDVGLSYATKGLSKIQYISGQYWVAKKYIMQEFPLNESLAHNDAEDIEWSRRVREKYEFSFNQYSTVHITKSDKWKPGLFNTDILRELCKKHNLPCDF